MNAVADALLRAAPEWEARDKAEAVKGIWRGLAVSAAGCMGPAGEAFADTPAKLAA